jgi:type II secretory pathway pseudopilin PulG
MLLGVTDFLTNWWWTVAAGLGFVVLCIVIALRTEKGRYGKDHFLLSIPVVGTTIQYALVERFCRILASMVNAGVSLPEALRVATDALRNRVYIRALSGVNEAMLEGQGIAAPLAKTDMFPPTAVQMLRVGEETGTLDAQLEVTAQYYETELDYKIKKLTSLFEPAVIIVMGLIVETLLELVVAIAILGICVVAFGTSIAIGVQVSDRHRKQADASAYVHNYAELIDSYVAAGHYVPCVSSNTYTAATVGLTLASNYSASQSAGLKFSAGAWGACSSDNGAQQLTLIVGTSDSRASEQLVMVIRKP